MEQGTWAQPSLEWPTGPTCPICGKACPKGGRGAFLATCGSADCHRRHRNATNLAARRAKRGPREFRCTKTCEDCGQRFGTNSGRQRCCAECRSCRWCHETMNADRLDARAKFCGPACEWNWRTENDPTPPVARECEFCGGPIVPLSNSVGGPQADTDKRRTCGSEDCQYKLRQSRWNHGVDPIHRGRFQPGQNRGDKAWNWKGGISPLRQIEMGRYEYKLWRFSVYKRDGFACVLCGAHGGKIHAHHIRPWRNHEELRYDVNNGVTLCKPCHEAMGRHESDFEAQLLAYVKTRQPVMLTPEEMARFRPIVVNCDQCGAELTRKRSDRGHTFFFCDKDCYTAFSRSMGVRWKEAVQAKRSA